MEQERNSHRFEGESDADFLLRTALDVAALTLRSGGEIHRVEETIRRICSAFGGICLPVGGLLFGCGTAGMALTTPKVEVLHKG